VDEGAREAIKKRLIAYTVRDGKESPRVNVDQRVKR
jgi:hypothetical protein